MAKEECGICHKEFNYKWWSEPPGVSKSSGIYYKKFMDMEAAENWDNIKYNEFKKSRWLPVCQNCYDNRAPLPEGIVDEIDLEKHKKDYDDREVSSPEIKTYKQLISSTWSFTENFNEVPEFY
jgi:hypothetical protein